MCIRDSCCAYTVCCSASHVVNGLCVECALQCFTCGEWFVRRVCTAVFQMWWLVHTLLCVQHVQQCFRYAERFAHCCGYSVRCSERFTHCCTYSMRCSASNVENCLHIVGRTVCTAVLHIVWMVCALLCIQLVQPCLNCGERFAHCCAYSVQITGMGTISLLALKSAGTLLACI